MPKVVENPKEKTNELEWYSRLAIWAGIAVLLIQSATGENPSWVTLIAVVLLAGGLGVFVVALARDRDTAEVA